MLCVDRFTKPENLQSLQGTETPGSSVEASSSQSAELPSCAIDIKGTAENVVSEEEEPLIQTVECRICQEEDGVKNLEVPCACSGSLKVSSDSLILIFFHIAVLDYFFSFNFWVGGWG